MFCTPTVDLACQVRIVWCAIQARDPPRCSNVDSVRMVAHCGSFRFAMASLPCHLLKGHEG
jgi:hypothetical protein